MGVYRYVGGAPAELLDTPYKFSKFGQLVEMPDDMAEHAIAHRVSLVPIHIWDSAALSDNEVQRHSRFESHAVASPEFLAKRDALWRKWTEHHGEVMAKRYGPKVSDQEAVTEEDKING